MGKDDTIMNTVRGLDISRYMLKSSKFTITFTSYAFPHGVERDIPVIRAEAIKHQLRFWWRIMTLSNGRYLSSSELKAKEDDLFGGIGKEGGKKSRITIQMLPASMPLASQIDAKPFSALGYLAYGTGGRSNQKQGYVPGDSAEFILSYPIERESEILGSLALMNGFGSIGGRSRKGIGSFIIESDILDIPSFASIAGSFAVMDWRDVYQGKLASISFPFCIAKDQKGILAWETDRNLPPSKILESFWHEYKAGRDEERQCIVSVLGEPSLRGNKLNSRVPRMASPLLFKIQRLPDGEYRGVLLHLPYNQFNEAGLPDTERQIAAWTRLHEYLDSRFKRLI